MKTMRARHEGRWTHDEATVKGSRSRNRWWIMLAPAALIVILAAVGYTRFWNFQTVHYGLRQCNQPLSLESTWAEVQAAACDPIDPAGVQLTIRNEGQEVIEPSAVEGSTLSFDDIPVNSPAPAIRIELDRPAGAIVLAEPDHERIRRELNGDASGTSWSANVGSRGPTDYWVLITP